MKNLGSRSDARDIANIGDITLPFSFSVTLLSSGWSSKSQTISNAAILTGDFNYIVAPITTQVEVYARHGIKASNVTTTGQITFTCATVPEVNIEVNIIRLPVEEVS